MIFFMYIKKQFFVVYKLGPQKSQLFFYACFEQIFAFFKFSNSWSTPFLVRVIAKEFKFDGEF